MSQRYTRVHIYPYSTIIRTAMYKRARHRDCDVLHHCRVSAVSEKSRDSTHDINSSENRYGKSHKQQDNRSSQ